MIYEAGSYTLVQVHLIFLQSTRFEQKQSKAEKRKFVPSDDEDDIPLSVRVAEAKKVKSSGMPIKRKHVDTDDEEDIPLVFHRFLHILLCVCAVFKYHFSGLY